MMSGEDIHRLVSPRLNRFLKVAPPSPSPPSSSSSSSSSSSTYAAHPASPSNSNRDHTVNPLYNIPSISPTPFDSHQGSASASHSPVTTSETILSTSTSQAPTHAHTTSTAHTAHTASKVLEDLHPILTEEAVGGKIPAWGFSLRLVTGGFLAGDGCSRCPWLARCQGCLIPRSGAMVCTIQGSWHDMTWHDMTHMLWHIKTHHHRHISMFFSSPSSSSKPSSSSSSSLSSQLFLLDRAAWRGYRGRGLAYYGASRTSRLCGSKWV